MTLQPNTGIDDAILEILHLSKHTKRAILRLSLTARGYYLTDRELRKHVESLIMDHHYAIQSSEKGYSLITTIDDLNAAKKYLNKKALSLLSRAKQLETNYSIGRLNQQIELFL